MIILHIDDDPDDRNMLQEAIEKLQPDIHLQSAENGLAGLQMLEQAKVTGNLPCLVILDINMPILDGRKTLEKIKRDPVLSQMPVVILTSSQNPNDAAFFNEHAAGFMTKPHNASAFHTIAQEVVNYCL